MERQRLIHVGELQKLSDNSIGMIAEKSGHDVHLAQPELVVEGVRKVVESVRERLPLATSR
jgi:hypothetical protein